MKLLIFAPCEKVIISDDKTTSLITLVEVVNISVGQEEVAALPADAVVPFNWHVYTLWHRESDDDDGQYEQRVRLITTDGVVRAELVMAFEVKSEFRNMRHNARIVGFPIPRIPGDCMLKLEMRRLDEPTEWEEIDEYPILVNFTAPPTEGK